MKTRRGPWLSGLIVALIGALPDLMSRAYIIGLNGGGGDIERMIVILSTTPAMCLKFSLNTTPGSFVFATPNGPRYSSGASGFGSHDS